MSKLVQAKYTNVLISLSFPSPPIPYVKKKITTSFKFLKTDEETDIHACMIQLLDPPASPGQLTILRHVLKEVQDVLRDRGPAFGGHLTRPGGGADAAALAVGAAGEHVRATLHQGAHAAPAPSGTWGREGRW